MQSCTPKLHFTARSSMLVGSIVARCPAPCRMPEPKRLCSCSRASTSFAFGGCNRSFGQPWRTQPSRAPAAHMAMSKDAGDSRGLEIAQNPYDADIAGVALPVLATMLLEPVLNFINTSMVGSLGTMQLSAASLGILVCNLMIILFGFLPFLTTPEVAAAMVKKDHAEVSRISSRTMWVAVLCGVISVTTLTLGGPTLIRAMAPPEPEVARMASQYVSIRAWGTFAIMLGSAATGVFRGFKDTTTPMYAAVGAACTSLCLSYLFIYVLQWGVAGSALAIAFAQGVSSIIICSLLVHKGHMKLQDLITPPSLSAVLPILRKGLALALRNLTGFGTVLFGNMLCLRMGSFNAAGFEVVRQLWAVSSPCFESINVATQALCANYLGAGDRRSASAALSRLVQVAFTVGVIMGALVFAFQLPLVHLFSRDPIVIAQVAATMPIWCLAAPLDAVASIMDGSLLAAKQSDYFSVTQARYHTDTTSICIVISQIIGSMLQLAVILYLASNNMVSVATIWGSLKVLTLARIVSGVARNWFSPRSAYTVPA